MTSLVESTMLEPAAAAPGTRRATITIRRFASNKLALVGIILIVLLGVAAFALPPLLPYSYTDIDYAALLQPPSATHYLGTTAIGQDMLALTLRGLQKSLLIGVLVALVSIAFAAIIGSIAGYFGQWIDRSLMWIVDLLLVIPSFLIVAIMSPTFKGKSWLYLVLLLAIFGWMLTARIVRGMTLSLREREFIRAARYAGAGPGRIIGSHILPNIASILIIDGTLAIGNAVMAETGLSFLGFGIQPPDVSLGTLIAAGTGSAFPFPWLFLVPGGVLIVTVLAANFIGDGLRDAFDPTSSATG